MKHLVILFLILIKMNVFADTGGFIVHERTHKKSFSGASGHANLTPVQMKSLYSTDLYHVFHDVLKLKGFDEYAIPRLFCIAKLESSFNLSAKNFNANGTTDTGLFQINSVWRNECNHDLHQIESNIDCAKIVLKKHGLKAWVTYKKRGYICEQSLEM